MDGFGSAPGIPCQILGRERPQHDFVAETAQFRVKVQRYSVMPAELTVQRIEFDRDLDRYASAARRGLPAVPRSGGSGRGVSKAKDPLEVAQRSERRAKTAVRRLVTELAPSALVTFTTREVMPMDALLWVWQYFNRLCRTAGVDLEYVAVPERHPTNPAHMHIHAAVRGRLSYSTLRRLWHIALEARHGRAVTCILKGKASPGNIDVQPIKGRQVVGRVRRIARYISKYITKDLIAEFNRKRYWPSRGINLQDAQRFWLSSLSQADAIREACELLGYVDDVGRPLGRPFVPDERIAWIAMPPDPA